MMELADSPYRLVQAMMRAKEFVLGSRIKPEEACMVCTAYCFAILFVKEKAWVCPVPAGFGPSRTVICLH